MEDEKLTDLASMYKESGYITKYSKGTIELGIVHEEEDFFRKNVITEFGGNINASFNDARFIWNCYGTEARKFVETIYPVFTKID